MDLLERRQEDPEVVEHIRRILDVDVSRSVSFPTPLHPTALDSRYQAILRVSTDRVMTMAVAGQSLWVRGYARGPVARWGRHRCDHPQSRAAPYTRYRHLSFRGPSTALSRRHSPFRSTRQPRPDRRPLNPICAHLRPGSIDERGRARCIQENRTFRSHVAPGE